MNSLITRFDEMDSLFNQLWSGGFGKAVPRDGDTVVLRPRVDVLESESDFVIEADLPGVDKNDLHVEIENGVLKIRAERKGQDAEGLQSLHRERATRVRYERHFTLGKEVDAERIEGQLELGVLRVRLPKKEKVLPRRIEVK